MIGEIERALKDAYRFIDTVPSELDKEPFLLQITHALMALRQIPTRSKLAAAEARVTDAWRAGAKAMRADIAAYLRECLEGSVARDVEQLPLPSPLSQAEKPE